MTLHDELVEIMQDIQPESHYTQAFTRDKETRELTAEVVVRAIEGSMATQRPEQALYSSGMALLTFGFYLGREHARRGYRSPIEPSDKDLPDIPDSPAGL